MKKRGQQLHFLVGFFILFSLQGISQTYKVMSYNIRYDNRWDTVNHWDLRKDKIVQQIQFYHPAILGIQEGLKNQVHFINTKLQNYKYIGVGREDALEKGEFSAIFYCTQKLELIKQNTLWLSKTPNKISIGWDAALERICTYGLFQLKGTHQKIWVFNTHFDHKGQIAREKSAELIVKTIQQVNRKKYPVILMGDFNSSPQSNPIQTIKKQLPWALDISRQPLYGPKATYNNFDTTKPPSTWIDFIFTQNLKVASYAHIDDRLDNTKYVSDHFPVLIEVSPK